MNEPISSLAAGPAVSPITFSGERRAFGWLVMRGALLSFVTLGFYRFWLATDIRRHLWSHTSVDGDPAEYTGRARELLIGFLFATAILLPVYLVYFLIGLEAERLRAFASLPLVVFFYLFSEFAMYRARRYRITRTVWRGLRFMMDGSGWSYSVRAGLWTLLAVITLGLAWPWRQAALERIKMRHTSYGSLQGRFEGTGKGLFKRAWGFWLLVVPATLLVIPLPFLYGAYKAVEWRWWISNIRFGDVYFESSLTRGGLIGIYWKVIGWLVLLACLLLLWSAGVLGLAAVTLGTGWDADNGLVPALQHPAVLVALGLGYLLTGAASGVVIQLHLTRDIWARIAATTVVHNLAAADDVAGQGNAANALGEGFADSFDIGGF